MAIKLSGNTIIDDSRRILNALDATFVGTSAITLPSGNTAQQPSPATAGMLRYNTDTASIEVHNGTEFASAGGSGGGAAGGGELVCGASSYTLTCDNQRHVSVCITGGGLVADVSLPDATTISSGSPTYQISNPNPSTTLVVKDYCCCILGTVSACCSSLVSLYDNSSSQGSWTVGGLSAPEGVIDLSTTCYNLGGCIVSYTDANNARHILSVDCSGCTICAQTYKPTSTGYCVTGSTICTCYTQGYDFRCMNCGWFIGQMMTCHSATCGCIGCNCGVVYLVNCDSTCTCCFIDDIKAQCTPTVGNWWNGYVATPCTQRLYGYFETNMSDTNSCSLCAARLWCIDNKTTDMPSANLVHCVLTAVPFTYNERRCTFVRSALTIPPNSDTSTDVILMTSGGSACQCNCWELFCHSPAGDFSRYHSGCGDCGFCCIGSWHNYTVNSIGCTYLINCQLTGLSNHYNSGASNYQLQKIFSICTDAATCRLCLKIPFTSLVNSGQEGNQGHNLDFIGCCLGIFSVCNTSVGCSFKQILRFCGTSPLTGASLCCYYFACCGYSNSCYCAYRCMFGLPSRWHGSCNQCCYNCGLGTPSEYIVGLPCGAWQFMVCNTSECVTWWAPSDNVCAPTLRRWHWNCSSCTLTQDCCLTLCNFNTCHCCFKGSGGMVFGSAESRACIHFRAGASYAICLCCASGTVNPIDCCENFMGICNNCHWCTGDCRYLYTSKPNQCSYAVVNYDFSTYPTTTDVITCFNTKFRNLVDCYDAATCRYVAYLCCCSGGGALDSEIVLAEYNPASCTFTYGVGIADETLYKPIDNINACGYSIMQYCDCWSPAFVRSFGKVKLI